MRLRTASGRRYGYMVFIAGRSSILVVTQPVVGGRGLVRVKDISHKEVRKGEQIPQTVESLLTIMERDAELMLAMHREISKLKEENNRLRQKLLTRS